MRTNAVLLIAIMSLVPLHSTQAGFCHWIIRPFLSVAKKMAEYDQPIVDLTRAGYSPTVAEKLVKKYPEQAIEILDRLRKKDPTAEPITLYRGLALYESSDFKTGLYTEEFPDRMFFGTGKSNFQTEWLYARASRNLNQEPFLIQVQLPRFLVKKSTLGHHFIEKESAPTIDPFFERIGKFRNSGEVDWLDSVVRDDP